MNTVGTNGAYKIAIERERQVQQEGWTPEHDDDHTEQELLQAAICYLQACDHLGAGECAGELWPWDRESWKPSDEPIHNLVRAGALIAAEIDRLQRTYVDHWKKSMPVAPREP